MDNGYNMWGEILKLLVQRRHNVYTLSIEHHPVKARFSIHRPINGRNGEMEVRTRGVKRAKGGDQWDIKTGKKGDYSVKFANNLNT